MNPPGYFNEVAAETQELWSKLRDPVVFGPWRQLFAQVQSPRHVLSELLQNADDAGAKAASVRVLNNEFVFEHDGEDFTAEQFQSLCRFGYSNKSNLHTIGFRGVGFKSTFSLGNSVRIQTRTLDVTFQRDQFTLPIWSANPAATLPTRITVPFSDHHRLAQLRMNLEEWAANPASLLFFRHLESLTIESHTIRKQIVAPGPIPGSHCIRLTGADAGELLLIRSAEEAFPEAAVAEIRQERNAESLHLPPCSVDLVLGLNGPQGLFVVLPSGTGLDLSFSINAPFLQDPARQRIKEPEVSPCNRWLLKRAGKLAGDALAGWLALDSLPPVDRAKAYRLLRGPVANAADLATTATKLVVDAMLKAVEGKPILLTAEDTLAGIGHCTALPPTLHEVWNPTDLTATFARDARNLLSPSVPRNARQAMEGHGWINSVPIEAAIQTLIVRTVVPKPSSSARLLTLWDWVQGNIGWDHQGERRRSLRIVPVDGQPSLQPAKDVIRVSSRSGRLSSGDWGFISSYAMTIAPDWLTHLECVRSKNIDDPVRPAITLLKAVGLDEPSQVDRIAAHASRRLFASRSVAVADCVRIAQIFAALDATAPDDFRFITQDGKPRFAKDHPIIHDPSGKSEALVPPAWAASHLLHSDYHQSFASCPRDIWFAWMMSPKSRLHSFIPLTLQSKSFSSRPDLGEFLKGRGGQSPTEFRYVVNQFTVDDFDFPPGLMSYWQEESASNPGVWAEIVGGILLDPLSSWKNAFKVTVRQRSSTGSTSTLNCGEPLPAWLVALRSLPCLTDTHGHIKTPPELLLRTPATETLLNLESFVAAELDSSGDKPALLRWLGVRDTATGWDRVVDRLRVLITLPDPMRFIAEVLRLYEALDRITVRCPAGDRANLSTVFAQEPLILSDSMDWLSSGELSIHADPEDDSPVVHSAARSLTLWLRVGVPDRPALERSLEWLKTLATGARLDGASCKRASLALARGGHRVWDDLGHWLSLGQTWEAVTTLKYRVAKGAPTNWENLTPPIKCATADLRMLPGEVPTEAPFAAARPLADVIEMRVTYVQPVAGRPRRFDWFQPLSDGLSRVKLTDQVVTTRIREIARRLFNTTWQTVNRVEVTPYIHGTPAGEPTMPQVLWSGTTLHVVDQPTVRLYRTLKDEIARPFAESSVADAVAHCIDRDAEFVREYLTANFDLEAQADALATPVLPKPAHGEAEDIGIEGGHRDADERPGSGPHAGANDGVIPDEEDRDESPLETAPVEATTLKPSMPPKPREPTFMDRYAKSRGFRWNEDGRHYTHVDGSRIAKGEPPFPWHEHASGSVLRKRLFVAEESLRCGVEIPSEIWRLMEINPDSIALVLSADNGQPEEWSATELKERHGDGRLGLFQSQFILKETTS